MASSDIQVEDIGCRIFLSYHKKNFSLATELVRTLNTEFANHFSKDDPSVVIWYDNAVGGGDRWEPATLTELECADIILFLITPSCLDANFMWNDEFPVAVERFRQGEGRIRLIPILYSDSPAPIRAHKFTKGLNHIPDQPHDQLNEDWFARVADGVIAAAEGVISQQAPPSSRLYPAISDAIESLRITQEHLIDLSGEAFIGPILVSDLLNTLEAIDAALGLPAQERAHALSVWEPKLRRAHVKMQETLGEHAERLGRLRGTLDRIATYASDEYPYPAQKHTPEYLMRSAASSNDIAGVRRELKQTQSELDELAGAPDPNTKMELDAREDLVETGSRHARIAQALLEESQIDASALAAEIDSLGSASTRFAAVLAYVGNEASALGLMASKRLARYGRRAIKWTARIVARARGQALPRAPKGPSDPIPNSDDDSSNAEGSQTEEMAPDREAETEQDEPNADHIEQLGTTGKWLKEAREEAAIKIDHIRAEFKYPNSFIRAIENGEKLSLETHVLGFVRDYARWVGLDPNHILRQYKTECIILREHQRKPKPHLRVVRDS